MNVMKRLVILVSLISIHAKPLPAQWKQTNGPYGGNVSCFVASPNGTGGTNLFAGTWSGVFHSTDDGTSWTPVGSDLPKDTYGNPIPVYALAVSPNAAGGTNLFAGASSGVFLSTDNGLAWTTVNADVITSAVNVLVVSPDGAGGTNLFAGTWSGVFLSTNNGTSWTAIDSGLGLATTDLRALAVLGTNLFAGTYGDGVFRSTNNGTRWVAANNGLTNHFVYALASSGSSLFAGTEDGVFLSSDDGTTWTDVDTGLTNHHVYALASSGSSLFAGTEDGLFLSTNDGASWASIGLSGLDIEAVLLSGTNLIAGGTMTSGRRYDGPGVFLSTDNGTSWTQTGISQTHILTLATVPTADGLGANLFAGTYGGAFLSTNNGASWSPTGLTRAGVHVLATGHDGQGGTILLAGTSNIFDFSPYGCGAFVSTDYGATWLSADSGMPSTTFVNAFLVFAGETGEMTLAAGTRDGIFLSANQGASWTDVGLADTLVLALAISHNGTGGANVFAGTGGFGVFHSTNSGESWIATNDRLASTYVGALAVTPKASGGTNLFAGTDGGIFLSTNDGTSWSAANAGLPNMYVSALAVSPNVSGGSDVFAGNWGRGVFLFANNSASWAEVTSGVPAMTEVSALSVSGMDLFVGTNQGLWRRSLSEMVTSVESRKESLPTVVSLEQNYPNPFNPATVVSYHLLAGQAGLPVARRVDLRVFDLLGREVAVLVDEEKTPGTYEVKFDASRLTSGVYLYRLNAGGFVQTRKMIVLK